MGLIRGLFKLIKYLIITIILFIVVICCYHNIMNAIENGNIKMPGDKIEVYDNEFIHSVRMGSGNYTVVFLPGMGTASPYYDYYKLASLVSKNNQVIVIEPFGYGFSDDIDKERTLDNYEYELSKVLDYYNVKDNIILLGHSYSGLSNLNYSKKHEEVKGIVCLDCTTAYQIETHLDNGSFKEEPPSLPSYYKFASPLGLSRFVYMTFMQKDMNKELLSDLEYNDINVYKHFLYSKTLNKTIINEYRDIYQNQLDLYEQKYNENLHVLTILSDETINEMKEYKESGDFYHDWEEMHNLLISNSNIQKIYVLNGNHYIHHGNTNEISLKINEMIKSIK